MLKVREYSVIKLHKIAIVIPCYKVEKHILKVLSKIGDEIHTIYVVDDACPQNTGTLVKSIKDPRIKVLMHEQNKGVGGAVVTGYKAAISDGMDVIVKIDGDGQMDPGLIPSFILPILNQEADYTKGNRFFHISLVKSMPRIRIFGNAILSFMTKLSSGYYNIFDPTNGFTAIDAKVASQLPLDNLSERYFFESDMLFRLNIIHGVVMDIPMKAKYADETSNLKIRSIIGLFISKHIKNFSKRLFYKYYLRDFSLASLELLLGIICLIFSFTYGIYHWAQSLITGVGASLGTIMLASLPLILGMQFILAFFGCDISSKPSKPLCLDRNTDFTVD